MSARPLQLRSAVLVPATVWIAALASVQPGHAQISGAAQLRAEVEAARADEVSFRYDTHDDVRNCSWRGKDRTSNSCWTGPAEVVLTLRDGSVTDLDVEIVRESEAPPRGSADLGRVPPEAAAEYLLDLVDASRPSVGEDAIGAAAMADEVEVWPRLLDFARDGALHTEVRQAATFWVGQASADEAIEGLRSIVDDDPDSEVKQSAVFALSQHNGVDVIPTLMEIAQENPDPEVRRSAFFWLAQHGDAEVLDFFERVLRGRG